MKRSLTTLAFFLFSLLIYSQNRSVTLTGSVQEKGDGTPIEQATIRLLTPKDSTLVKGGVTNLGGQFNIPSVKSGTYLIEVAYLGFDTYYQTITTSYSKSTQKLEPIQLSATSYSLSEATVTGKAPEIVVKTDTVEYNADSYKTQPNAVVEDLLKKLPGVEVDSDGKITASGKEITKILIDGKEFFSDDTNVASKNLPVDIINKLQVVERKSEMARLTGVDDGEEEMVINITIKEGMKKGWFGDIKAGGGTKERYESNLMVNRFVGDNQYSILGAANNTNKMGFADMGRNFYSGSMQRNGSGGINTTQSGGVNFNVTNKNESLNVGGDAMYAASQVVQSQRSSRQNIFKDSVSYSDSEFDNINRSQNFALNLRIRWNIDSLTTLDFKPRASLNSSTQEQNSLSTALAGNADRDSVNHGENSSYGEGDGYKLSGALTFNRKSATKEGRQYSLSLNYSNNNTREVGTNYNQTQFYLNDSLSIVDQETDDKTLSQSYSVRANYIEPLGNNYFLTLSYNYKSSENRSDKFAYDLNNNHQLDSLYSNSFRNLFTSSDYNVSMRSVKTKYIYNVGVNLTPSTSESENMIDTLRSVPSRSVFNISPMMYYMYKFDTKESLRFDYNGRTVQPSISQLQPVTTITNPLYIKEGNPLLDPSYVSSIRLRYSNYIPEKQRSVMLNLSGGFTMNSIVNQTTYNAETGVQTTRPVNVNGVWNSSAVALFSTPLFDQKFQISSFTRGSYDNNVGFTSTDQTDSQRNNSTTLRVSENINFSYRSDLFDAGIRGSYSITSTRNSVQDTQNQDVQNFGGNFNTTIYLPLDIVLASDINYSGNEGYADGYAEDKWIWNAHLTTQFLKNKQATISLHVYDILQQQTTISRQVTGNYIQDSEYNALTSYAMLQFSYRFNTMGDKGRGPQQPNGERTHPMGGGRGGMRPM